jgi:hypothetical protein
MILFFLVMKKIRALAGGLNMHKTSIANLSLRSLMEVKPTTLMVPPGIVSSDTV